ncbi:hypothetical protein [Paraburkholderia sp. 2C]
MNLYFCHLCAAALSHFFIRFYHGLRVTLNQHVHAGTRSMHLLQEGITMQHASGSDALFLPVWIAATFGTLGMPEVATAESVEAGTVEVARGATVPCGPQAVGGSGPLTLFIQPPTGRTMKLTYSVNDGWNASPTRGATTQVAGAAYAVASQTEPESEAGQPITVFIDGPSGFTYFWIPDVGWKFVGRVTDRIQ